MAKQPLLQSQENSVPDTCARKIVVSGQVQGVGFRPFIYRLAITYQLLGWVRNAGGVVEIFVQGSGHNINNFTADIISEKPLIAKPSIQSDETAGVEALTDFSILTSLASDEAAAQSAGKITLPVDLFLCDDCLTELNNPQDRRYRYPFINCTQCGPRYTLIRSLPYDRVNTVMSDFKLCEFCLAEYTNPLNRRYHAEPVACAECGPSLSFRTNSIDDKTSVIDDNETSLKCAVNSLRQGRVVAVKGIGGYHLMCDAQNTEAVNRLRKNKARADKPLAVMFPAPAEQPFKFVELAVELSEQDKIFLLQATRPVLLLKKKLSDYLSSQIAPGLNETGVMLAYSPLHHLLLNDFGGPLVATSANISGEPVLTDNQDIEQRLGHVADDYLHHNRPIERPADDPVYKYIAGKARPIRLGRGSAPLELMLPFTLPYPVLAVGAHKKNTITLAWQNRAIISPHIGGMNSLRSLEVFEKTIKDLQQLYAVTAERIICDAHPGYTTTKWAKKQTLPLHYVYHHHAHASAAFYESKCQDNGQDNDQENMIAFTWDGTGYGEDGTLWGGETFYGHPGSWLRVASMSPFYLPGGDKAARQLWRSAAALCWQSEESAESSAGEFVQNMTELDPLIKQAWLNKINTSQSSSVGRLFDAAVSLTGLRSVTSYEGQGAMEFSALCESVTENRNKKSAVIPLDLIKSENLLLTNWQPLVKAMLDSSISITERALQFHVSLANVILQQANAIRAEYTGSSVSLSGGVFQNKLLTELACRLLTDNGFTVYIPELIPVNDAGISFGQVIEYGFKQ